MLGEGGQLASGPCRFLGHEKTGWRLKGHVYVMACGNRPRAERCNTGTSIQMLPTPLGEEKATPNLELLASVFGRQRFALHAL